MSTGTYVRTKPHLNIGIMGPSQSGKSLLTAAILKAQAAQGLAECKTYAEITDGGTVLDESKTVSVKAYRAECETSKRHYALIDCPGHADHVEEVFVACSQMDGAILVVSALDGLVPDVERHLARAVQAGVSSLVVYINGSDLVSDEPDDRICQLENERICQLEEELHDLFCLLKLPEAEVVSGSALLAMKGVHSAIAKIQELLAAVDSCVPEPTRRTDLPFRMQIESSFVGARGTMAVGRIQRGSLKPGDELDIVGLGDTTKGPAMELCVFGKLADQVIAGDLVSVRLRGVSVEEARRGRVLSRVGCCDAYTEGSATVYVLTEGEGGDGKPVFKGDLLTFHTGTAAVSGKIRLPDVVEMLMPGDRCTISFTLDQPVALELNAPLLARLEGRTIAMGKLTKLPG